MTTTTTPYDFDTRIERRGTGSAKWDWFGDALPLWVADMDFRSPEPIIRALHDRVEHGVFGYQADSPRLRDILVQRMEARYGWSITSKDIQFTPNLVSATNAVIRAYAQPNEAVMILTPAYPPFLSAPKNSKHESILPALVSTRQGQILHYEMDFDAVEAAITPGTKVFLLCNPHNPVGRAWTRSELERLADICLRHDLIICSDEIHCDLLADGVEHIPMATLSPEVAARTITLMAPSKTFNIPTLHLGFAIAQNPDVMARFQETTKEIIPGPGAIGFVAAEAAYAECQDWLDALLVYLEGNRNYLIHYVQEHLPQVNITRPEATYLAWLDWREVELPDAPFKFFLEKARVAFSDGAQFGQAGEGFLRLNYACPRAMLTEGLDRVRAALEAR